MIPRTCLLGCAVSVAFSLALLPLSWQVWSLTSVPPLALTSLSPPSPLSCAAISLYLLLCQTLSCHSALLLSLRRAWLLSSAHVSTGQTTCYFSPFFLSFVVISFGADFEEIAYSEISSEDDILVLSYLSSSEDEFSE